ncbi:MAG: sulfur carrier protein ThiS [Candidatus Dormibacteria bacterium]
MTAPAETGQVTVNGDLMEIPHRTTIGALLERLDVRPARVVVELNGTIYKRGEGLEQEIAAGDVVEIVHFVGGG